MTETRDIRCAIVAHATVVARADAVAALRDAPDPPGAPVLPSRFLRHADDHTVVGVRAIQKAIATLAPESGAFERWGVVAATCAAGRPASARTLVQFRDSGPVTVSPHIVPQCSLHAAASAVSVGLGMHGPNVGVGGGPEAPAEGVLAALALVAEPGVAGCWLLLTAWDEEPLLDASGTLPDGAVCRALALALDPAAAGGMQLTLRRGPAVVPVGEIDGPSLAALAAGIASASDRADSAARPIFTLRVAAGLVATIEVASEAAARSAAGRQAA